MSRWIAALRRLADHLPAVYADIAPFRAVGPGLVSVSGRVPDIAMRREVVDIHLFSRRVAVEAVFEMDNQGSGIELEVGFPSVGAPSVFQPTDAGLFDFEVKVEGAAIDSVQQRLDDATFPLWRVWRQCFPAGQISRVEVRYWTPLASYRGVSRCPFVYVLRTGKFWKGSIGEALIRLHAQDIPFRAIREVYPPPHDVDPAGRRLDWRFVDLIPEHDIGLCVSPSVIMGAFAGVRIVDPIDILGERPPSGTRLCSAGIFSDELLCGERFWDANLIIPDGIRAFDRYQERDKSMTTIAVRRGPSTRETTIDVPWWEVWRPRVVTGIVAYEGERPVLLAEEIATIESGPRSQARPQTTDLRQSFSWIREPYPRQSAAPQTATRWTEPGERQADTRARLFPPESDLEP